MKPNDLINWLVAGFIGLLIGGAAGFFFGYDVGFERALSSMPPQQQNGGMMGPGDGGAAGTMPAVNTFEECAAEGNPVMESFPRQCRTPDGRLFIEGEADEPDDWTDTPGVTPPPSDGASDGDGCVPAGCSGVICAEADEAANIITTCEYRAEYACYELTTCERQANGECGWTETDEFNECLADPPALQ